MVLRYSAYTLSFISWHEMQNSSRLVHSIAVLKPPQNRMPSTKVVAPRPAMGVRATRQAQRTRPSPGWRRQSARGGVAGESGGGVGSVIRRLRPSCSSGGWSRGRRVGRRAASLQAACALEGVVHQRLGVGLRHVALGAEVAARADVVELGALAGAEVRDADLGRAADLGLLPSVAVHALVVVLGDLVAVDGVRDQRRLLHEVAVV